MHPIHDTDLQLLLATTLAAKRKPAPLAAIIAALDLLHGAIPSEAKLGEAFYRLGTNGLLLAVDDGFTLSPDAQKMMATQPKRGAVAEHIFSLKEKLATYNPPSEGVSIIVGAEDIETAIKTHRASAQGAGKNLLMPIKSKETDNKRAGPGRRPMARKPGKSAR
jgi:hypothetical protein